MNGIAMFTCVAGHYTSLVSRYPGLWYPGLKSPAATGGCYSVLLSVITSDRDHEGLINTLLAVFIRPLRAGWRDLHDGQDTQGHPQRLQRAGQAGGERVRQVRC